MSQNWLSFLLLQFSAEIFRCEMNVAKESARPQNAGGCRADSKKSPDGHFGVIVPDPLASHNLERMIAAQVEVRIPLVSGEPFSKGECWLWELNSEGCARIVLFMPHALACDTYTLTQTHTPPHTHIPPQNCNTTSRKYRASKEAGLR